MPLFRLPRAKTRPKQRVFMKKKLMPSSWRTDDDGSVVPLTRLCLLSLAENMKNIWTKDYADNYMDHYSFRYIMGPFNCLREFMSIFFFLFLFASPFTDMMTVHRWSSRRSPVTLHFVPGLCLFLSFTLTPSSGRTGRGADMAVVHPKAVDSGRPSPPAGPPTSWPVSGKVFWLGDLRTLLSHQCTL